MALFDDSEQFLVTHKQLSSSFNDQNGGGQFCAKVLQPGNGVAGNSKQLRKGMLGRRARDICQELCGNSPGLCRTHMVGNIAHSQAEGFQALQEHFPVEAKQQFLTLHRNFFQKLKVVCCVVVKLHFCLLRQNFLHKLRHHHVLGRWSPNRDCDVHHRHRAPGCAAAVHCAASESMNRDQLTPLKPRSQEVTDSNT